MVFDLTEIILTTPLRDAGLMLLLNMLLELYAAAAGVGTIGVL